MGLARMAKVRVVGHNALRERVLEVLQAEGVLQLADLSAKAREASPLVPQRVPTAELEKKIDAVRFVLELIERHSPSKKGLIESFAPTKQPLRAEELATIAAQYDYTSVYTRARALERELATLRAEAGRAQNIRQELLPWVPLDIPVEQLVSTAHVVVVLGRIPSPATGALQDELRPKLGEHLLLRRGAQLDSKDHLCVILPSASAEEFTKIATGHGFERIAPLVSLVPSGLTGTPRDLIAQLDRQIAALEAKRVQVTAEVRQLAAERQKLFALYDHWNNELLRLATQEKLLGSRSAFVLEGWVREQDYQRLETALGRAGDAISLSVVQPDPNEKPPVALANRRLFKPAEVVVQLFGLPQPKELDPTPFVLPFFALFFGVALTDAGYGLSLVIIFYFLKRLFKGPGFRQFANLIMLGGAVAIVAGALTGGWFGPELVSIVPFLKTFYVFDVSGSAGLVAFLGFSLVLGYVQVMLGNLLEIYDKARSGRFWDALWHEGAWVVLLLGLGLYAGIGLPPLLGMPGLPPTLAPTAMTLLLSGFLLVLFLARAEPDRPPVAQLPWLALAVSLLLYLLGAGGGQTVWLALALVAGLWALLAAPAATVGKKLAYLLGRLGTGLFKLYGATGFLGDVLSYARIMALGIATGLIAMSVNTFAQVFGQLIPDLFGLPAATGVVITVLILVIGQPFSLIINTLSAFVHSARLQYVEFFTKFYESGGQRFRPFSRETVYYDVRT